MTIPISLSSKVLIYAAGAGRRWANSLGVPKQLLEIDNECLLDRMIRQCNERGVFDITIIGPESDPRYLRKGARLEFVEVMSPDTPEVKEAPDKCLNSVHLWSDVDQTVCLLGDTWFEDDAMDKIFSQDRSKTFVIFARADMSLLTGKHWGEDFACSFWPSDREKVKSALESFQLTDATPWRKVAGEFQKKDDSPHWVELGGFTEDFDHPCQLERWFLMRDRYRYEKLCTDVKIVCSQKQKLIGV